MRLWHENLIKKLPRQQLLGQHRECCALRGKGWGKPHATVNYVFQYSPYKLYQYHQHVIEEMLDRGYQPDLIWPNPCYRGQSLLPYANLEVVPLSSPIYPEHDQRYLNECLANLKAKGIYL
ncbi:TIGR02328 family protein [Lactococcus taiwanensis]|uniref:TIGR02328 family protein n=1 Tax=Lactococcus taiwanensis TaxID=1151742 RepID=UPI0035124DF4